MRATIPFFCLAGFAALAQTKLPVTPEAIEQIDRLPSMGRGMPAAWAPDGSQWVYREGGNLMIFDASKQTGRLLTDTKPMTDAAAARAESAGEPFGWQNRRVSEDPVQWSSNGKEILYSTGGDLFLIQIDDGTWQQITKTETPEHDPKLSPDGSMVVFRRDWDLYVLDLKSRQERRLTTGGSETLRNGGLDWVYPEELDLGTAYWWSPDSKSIAYLQFDTTVEPITPHEDLTSLKAVYEPERYPHPGDHNPKVRMGVIAAKGGKTKWIDIGDTTERYLIARVDWAPDSKSLWVVRPNRVQNQLELLAFDASSGGSRVVLKETDPYWINVADGPTFVKDGKQFLWLSERDGFEHIYLYEADGKLVRQLTSGKWEVTALNGVSESASGDSWVYYTSSEPGPTERQIYRVTFDGMKQPLATAAGNHSMMLAPGGGYYLHSYSNLETPTQVTIDSDGRELGVYRPKDRRAIDLYDILPSELITYKGPDGTEFHARLIKPKGFDPSKKYPTIVSVYGGPQAQQVRNAWSGVTLDLAFAQAGFVVWLMDNRGSVGRGHAFEAPVFRNLGELELKDQVDGVAYLVSLGFVDPARVGIRGWSYGGFMTLNAMLNAPDTFHAGAAGAPVTDWRNYDTIYTERYMGLMPDAEAGYKKTSLPQRAANLKGKLLLMHNIEDDNVLFQNSVQMIKALELADKQFELMLYTQKTHGVSGQETRHLNETMLGFFERNLK